MNRSLRNLAFLGLLALGASTAGAQNNVLFNVTYNPTDTKITITPTSTNNTLTWTGGSAGNVISGTVGGGIYLENFFSNSPPSGSNGQFSTVSVAGGLQALYPTAPVPTPLNEAFTDDLYALNIARVSPVSPSIISPVQDPLEFKYGLAAFSSSQSLVLDFSSSVDNLVKKSQIELSTFSGGNVSVFVGGQTYVVGTYSYSAVPEPSTYAAIAGALGLAYAVYRRRRQAAAATASA